jgi:simple sugar transport system substrate-binding protein
LAFNLIDDKAFDEVVAEAAKQDVPVIAFNVDDNATENARLAAVSQKFYEAGQSLAKHVLLDIPEDAHILMTKHDENVSALEERLRGMQDVLKQKGIRWTTIVTGNDAAKGADAVADALRQNPEVRIVLSSGQSDTEAAGRAIEQNFKGKDFWAAGFDFSPKTLELIRDGHIRVTVDQQPYVQGFYPVVALALKLRYGIQPADIDAGAALIDAGNVAQIIELSKEGYR